MSWLGKGAIRQIKAASTADLTKVFPWEVAGLSRVQKVIQFLEFLPITKGILINTKLALLPDQRAFIRALYGAKSQAKIAVFSQPRGNGKTGLTAGLALCHLLGPEAEFRGEIYSAAIDSRQAAIIADEMEAVILAIPEFAAMTTMRRHPYRVIEVNEGRGIGSKYEALTSDGRRGHGISPTVWIYDELAQAKDRVLLDSLTTAMGKRRRSLGIIISTQAQFDDHPLSQLIDLGLSKVDPTVLVHLRAAPMDADPFSLSTIRKVNPALGKFLSEEDVFAEARRAKQLPGQESSFRNTRLNQRVVVSGEAMFLSPTRWAACAGPIDKALFFDGRPVYAGFDLSNYIDLTAFVLICADDDGNWHIWPTAWTPNDTLHERMHTDRAPYDVWVRGGHLMTTPGASINYDTIVHNVCELTKGMNLEKVHFDEWNKNALFEAFDRLGWRPPLLPFKQSFAEYREPVSQFEKMVADEKVRHGDHPVLKWCIANTMMEKDVCNNRKPNKKRSTVRIDLAVAAIMAAKGLAERQFNAAAMIG
jgi:phage terminase large subunit-like protein